MEESRIDKTASDNSSTTNFLQQNAKNSLEGDSPKLGFWEILELQKLGARERLGLPIGERDRRTFRDLKKYLDEFNHSAGEEGEKLLLLHFPPDSPTYCRYQKIQKDIEQEDPGNLADTEKTSKTVPLSSKKVPFYRKLISSKLPDVDATIVKGTKKKLFSKITEKMGITNDLVVEKEKLFKEGMAEGEKIISELEDALRQIKLDILTRYKSARDYRLTVHCTFDRVFTFQGSESERSDLVPNMNEMKKEICDLWKEDLDSMGQTWDQHWNGHWPAVLTSWKLMMNTLEKRIQDECKNLKSIGKNIKHPYQEGLDIKDAQSSYSEKEALIEEMRYCREDLRYRFGDAISECCYLLGLEHEVSFSRGLTMCVWSQALQYLRGEGDPKKLVRRYDKSDFPCFFERGKRLSTGNETESDQGASDEQARSISAQAKSEKLRARRERALAEEQQYMAINYFRSISLDLRNAHQEYYQLMCKVFDGDKGEEWIETTIEQIKIHIAGASGTEKYIGELMQTALDSQERAEDCSSKCLIEYYKVLSRSYSHTEYAWEHTKEAWRQVVAILQGTKNLSQYTREWWSHTLEQMVEALNAQRKGVKPPPIPVRWFSRPADQYSLESDSDEQSDHESITSEQEDRKSIVSEQLSDHESDASSLSVYESAVEPPSDGENAPSEPSSSRRREGKKVVRFDVPDRDSDSDRDSDNQEYTKKKEITKKRVLREPYQPGVIDETLFRWGIWLLSFWYPDLQGPGPEVRDELCKELNDFRAMHFAYMDISLKEAEEAIKEAQEDINAVYRQMKVKKSCDREQAYICYEKARKRYRDAEQRNRKISEVCYPIDYMEFYYKITKNKTDFGREVYRMAQDYAKQAKARRKELFNRLEEEENLCDDAVVCWREALTHFPKSEAKSQASGDNIAIDS